MVRCGRIAADVPKVRQSPWAKGAVGASLAVWVTAVSVKDVFA